MDNKPDISQLKAYLDGTCTALEKASIEQWLDKSPELVDVFFQIKGQTQPVVGAHSKERIKRQLLLAIDEPIKKKPGLISHSYTKKNTSKTTLWRVAAVMVFTVVTSFLVYSNFLLSVSGGEILLHETRSPSMKVTTVTLSDGTVVHLNANSVLRYPERFGDLERAVFLTGEAFFDVTHDPERPFTIATGEVTTMVLGTKFNVNYRPGKSKMEVALQEGKVVVQHINDTLTTPVVLRPNEWVSYSFDKATFILGKGLGNKLLWKESILEFEGLTLAEVASMLEAWYGVTVEITNSKAVQCTVVGTFENEPLEQVLKGLQFVIGTSYEINEDSVILSGGGCQ